MTAQDPGAALRYVQAVRADLATRTFDYAGDAALAWLEAAAVSTPWPPVPTEKGEK